MEDKKGKRYTYFCDEYTYSYSIYDEEKEIEYSSDAEIMVDILNKQDKENKILEKALELACEQIWAMSIWENTKEEIIQDNIKFFKDKAKEMK